MSQEIIYVVGAVLLLAALAYGVMQSRNRNKVNDPITDKATRDIYKKSEAEYESERVELKKEIRPS